MPATFALGRTPILDSSGNLSRQWLLYFASLAPGAGGGTPSGNAVPITVSGGIATPDLSLGTTFILVLTADTTLALPANAPAGITPWTLIVQQDGVGGHSLLLNAYPIDHALATAQSPANTECVQAFLTDASGTRVAGAPAIDQKIP